MNKYTVVGYYRDNDQPFVEWVEEKDPLLAAFKAVANVMDQREIPDDDNSADDLEVVAVMEGHHKDVLGYDTTHCGGQLLDLVEQKHNEKEPPCY